MIPATHLTTPSYYMYTSLGPVVRGTVEHESMLIQSFIVIYRRLCSSTGFYEVSYRITIYCPSIR